MTIFLTSIAPNSIEGQSQAISSWNHGDSRVVSVNAPSESRELVRHFPEVNFIEPVRTAREVYSKPYPYVYDMLKIAEGLTTPNELVILINSDNYLLPSFNDQVDCIHSDLLGNKIGLVFSSRKDIGGSPSYNIYLQGFDCFIFISSSVKYLRPTELIFGLPWWDYWLPLEFQRTQAIAMSIHSLTSHNYHENRWSEAAYQNLAKEMAVINHINTNESSNQIGLESLNKIYDLSTLYIPRSKSNRLEQELRIAELDMFALSARVELLQELIDLTKVSCNNAFYFESLLSAHHPVEQTLLENLLAQMPHGEPFIVLFDAFQNSPGRHNQRWRKPISFSRDSDLTFLLITGIFVNFDSIRFSGLTQVQTVRINFPLVSIDEDCYLGLRFLKAAYRASDSGKRVTLSPKPKLIVWGAGDKLYREIRALKIFFRVAALCDASWKRVGTSVDSLRVQSIEECKSIDASFLYIASDTYYREIHSTATRDFSHLIIINDYM